MKKFIILKALVIIIPVVIAIFAQQNEQKKQKQLVKSYELASNTAN